MRQEVEIMEGEGRKRKGGADAEGRGQGAAEKSNCQFDSIPIYGDKMTA